MVCHAVVIEDNHTLQLMLAEILTDLGFQVQAARDGAEAMRILETLSPHLVTLDLTIPGTPALQILQHIRQHEHDYRTTAVLYSGGRPQDYPDEVALADLFLKKPDGIPELVALAEQIIRRAEETLPSGTTIRQQLRQQKQSLRFN
jgi:two-component system, OmpR family, KDP operon response regulator KdpE